MHSDSQFIVSKMMSPATATGFYLLCPYTEKVQGAYARDF